MSAVILLLQAAGCAVCGFTVGWLGIRLFNTVPAAWFCDYGETPPVETGIRLPQNRYLPGLGILFGFLFFLLLLQYGFSDPFVLYCLACIPAVLIALADRKYQIIPDQFVLVLAGLGAVNALVDCISGKSFLPASFSLLGGLTGGLLWALVGLVGWLVYRRESIGFGDIKLSTALGLLCGFPLAVAAFLGAVVFAGLHFTFLLTGKKIDGNRYMPLGPYLCAAAVLTLVFREQVLFALQWYCSLL